MTQTPIKLLIDCDPGCDDSVMLALALAHPERFEILGVSSIGGNTNPKNTQRNALGICDLMGRHDVQVVAGARYFLSKPDAEIGEVEDEHHAENVHGVTGVQGLVLNEEGIQHLAAQQRAITAAAFMVEQINKNPNDLTLVVTGPMTNVALAFQLDPSIAHKVKLVVMGGAFGNPTGNIGPDNCAEFNTWCDPVAADMVYQNFHDITVMPLDVTHMTLQDRAFRRELADSSPQGLNFALMLAAYARTYPNMEEIKREQGIQAISPVHDAHTIMSLLDPEMYEMKRMSVSVEHGNERAGAMVASLNDDGNVKVAVGVDRDRFMTGLKGELIGALKHRPMPGQTVEPVKPAAKKPSALTA